MAVADERRCGMAHVQRTAGDVPNPLTGTVPLRTVVYQDSLTSQEGRVMAMASLRRWARLSIPVGMVGVGLAFRLTGVLPGWATLLILGGTIGGALVAYVVLLGDHERFMVVDRATEESRFSLDPHQGLSHPFRGERGPTYDGR